MQRATDLVAAFLAGVVAAEGCFTRSGRRFRFSVHLGAVDAGICEMFHAFLDIGAVRHYRRRRPHHDDEVIFSVDSIRDLVGVVVPFMDAHLGSSHKRAQYETWRSGLLEYWENTYRRRGVCDVDGCGRSARAKGLCRGHYYARYGR